MDRHRLLIALGHLLPALPLFAAGDPFAENIRPTEHLRPAEQERKFRLPPGFSIQCFAAEPDIAKPMNMAFDERGRLWVTVTREYPFPVPAGQLGRDEIRILEDTDGDGRADKVTVFADGLNIPIGLYPYRDGCVVWSIPNIWFLRDTDGDGRADRREVLYGPLGWERDTHGNNSSFTRGYDGWLYATHGYNNDTKVQGKDGHEIHMNSGNTYRFRLDGSRIEQNSWGQVNPFGLCFDSRGLLYSADCHSEPVYQVISGGFYPSFGKPHDGLGFAPSMIFHDHGSTAISGIWFYEGEDWPEEFRGDVFTGNVMTSRVNRDHLTFQGSTPLANERPDLVISEDPWFRPVNIQLGPDGALYVADFYNRIIGHYEVPLKHPGRDRESGRIWRITGPAEKNAPASAGPSAKATPRFNLSQASADALIAELASANATRRRLATDQLADRLGQAAANPLVQWLEQPPAQAPARQVVHALWALYRIGSLSPALWQRFVRHADPLVRMHALRMAATWPEMPNFGTVAPSIPQIPASAWTVEPLRQAARAALPDANAFVQRAAAEVLAKHADIANLAPLQALLAKVPAADTHLLYQVRLALRNQLRLPGALSQARQLAPSETEQRQLADVALGVATPEAGSFLLQHLRSHEEPRDRMIEFLRHVARHAPAADLAGLAGFVRTKFSTDPGLQWTLYQSVQDGIQQRGGEWPREVRAWGTELAAALLASVDTEALGWMNEPMAGVKDPTNPWFLQQRNSADGDRASTFLCSLPPGGERLTGILRTRAFDLPARLTFFLAGHDGYPDRPAQGRNKVLLRDAKTGEVLAEATPPRNDMAQRILWNLPASPGRQGVLEVMDGDTGDAFAWLAVGRFEPAVVPLPAVSPNQIPQHQIAAAQLSATHGLTQLQPALLRLFLHPSVEPASRAALGRALLSFHPDPRLEALVPLLGETTVPPSLRQHLTNALAVGGAAVVTNAAVEAFRTIPRRQQVTVARDLASTLPGAELLLTLVQDHWAPAALLAERSVRDRLAQGKPTAMAHQITELTQGLPAANEAIQALIETRRKEFQPTSASATHGNEVFTKNCRPCHQIDNQGALIGPQLDGIGGRGLERLLEDVLDPNRNVDRAFRNTIITLKDGDIISGLFRREVGETLVLADSTGKEITVPKADVHERRESETSLMPENFGEVITQADFNDLLAFLLSKAVGGPGRP